MTGIVIPEIEEYINSLLPARDAILRQMETYARRHQVPIVGPACGRVLYQLARLIRARRVFELGSAIGYSTLWLARAVGPQGMVYYTDDDPDNARRAGVLDRIRILAGESLESFKGTRGSFDLIFNDVDKTRYPAVFRLAVPRLRVGGLFVTDNVLYHGHVATKPSKGDAKTRAVLEFNRLIYGSPRLFTTIIPLRDGLAVSQRLT
jgi:predicted O-methyltransferase YrrM